MDGLNFKLPVFEGPLDLLLHLIEKNKLDIYDIPILEITRQYLDFLRSWDEMNLEIASEFIVMAATLINIKAKRLLPEAEKKDEEEENEEAELIRRLLIYKQYNEASANLKNMLQPSREEIFFRSPQTILGEKPIPSAEELLSGISLEELYALMERQERLGKEMIDPIRSGFTSVRQDAYTVAEKIEHLQKSLELFEEVSFYRLRSESHSKEETITYFMAMLELSRMNQAVLRQSRLFGDIIVSRKSSDHTEEEAVQE